MSEEKASASNPEFVLRILDDTVSDHHDYMRQWHRDLVCQISASHFLERNPDELAAQTALGRALKDHAGVGLLGQPSFAELYTMHRSLLKKAHDNYNGQAQGATLRVVDYDAMTDMEARFLQRVSLLQRAFRKAQSELDPLTGLHNRQTMLMELQAEYDRAMRTDQQSCIALTDIDHFKAVNDTYGHAAGDQVLSVTAGRFLSVLRPYDRIYRYGGEEFLVCLPNASMDTAITILERLRGNLEGETIKLNDGRALSVTSSFGVTLIETGKDLNTLIEQADQALYHAKKSGRNRVCRWPIENDI